jgi:hypothetical protein
MVTKPKNRKAKTTKPIIETVRPKQDVITPCKQKVCYAKYYPNKLGRPTTTPCGGVHFRCSNRIAGRRGEIKEYELLALPM